MKGNRLNTAANVGTFVTSRQQLEQQRKLAADTSAMLDIQRRQAYEVDYDRLLNRTDRDVAEGRITRGQADYSLLVARTDRAVVEGHKTPTDAFHDLLVARAELDVAEGRLTRNEADTHIELEWYNHINPAPKPGSRVTHSFGAMLNASLSSATAGWYNTETGVARRWDGARWTLETTSATAAKEIARHEWLSVTAEGRVQSRGRRPGSWGSYSASSGRTGSTWATRAGAGCRFPRSS